MKITSIELESDAVRFWCLERYWSRIWVVVNFLKSEKTWSETKSHLASGWGEEKFWTCSESTWSLIKIFGLYCRWLGDNYVSGEIRDLLRAQTTWCRNALKSYIAFKWYLCLSLFLKFLYFTPKNWSADAFVILLSIC